MTKSSQGETEQILDILRSVREAQTDHGRVLDKLQTDFRSLGQNATFVAGIALLARHEAECATARVDQTDQRLDLLEQRLISVEARLGK